MSNARFFRRASRFVDPILLMIDSDRARAVLSRCCDRNAPIAATEIIDNIVRCYLRERKKSFDDFRRSGDVWSEDIFRDE